MTSRDKAKDSGMAVTLIFLLITYLGGREFFVVPAIVSLVLTMTWPQAFGPFSRLWFGLSHALGTVVSKAILTIIFFCVATPVGLVRRLLGSDSLRLREWKQGGGSVFTDRNHTYGADELERPY